MANGNKADREVFAVGSLAFSIVALVIAIAAIFTAATAVSHSNKANKKIAALSKGGGTTIGSTSNVTLEEFSITAKPGLVQAGKVTLHVDNVGTITHEMVLIRAASPAALPKVTTAGGERSVGAIDEEAIPEVDTMGETGDVPAHSKASKTFTLTAGTYVMFCNIDSKAGGKTVNHFVQGMVATLVVV